MLSFYDQPVVKRRVLQLLAKGHTLQTAYRIVGHEALDGKFDCELAVDDTPRVDLLKA